MTPTPPSLPLGEYTILQMSTFSIAGADDDDDFAELINAKSNAKAAPASGKAGAVEPVPGAVPLKTPAPTKGESSH